MVIHLAAKVAGIGLNREKPGEFMERRALKRMPAGITIKLFYRSAFYTGIVTDLSEKGMFISTHDMCFPFDSRFEVDIDFNGKKTWFFPNYLPFKTQNPGDNAALEKICFVLI